MHLVTSWSCCEQDWLPPRPRPQNTGTKRFSSVRNTIWSTSVPLDHNDDFVGLCHHRSPSAASSGRGSRSALLRVIPSGDCLFRFSSYSRMCCVRKLRPLNPVELDSVRGTELDVTDLRIGEGVSYMEYLDVTVWQPTALQNFHTRTTY